MSSTFVIHEVDPKEQYGFYLEALQIVEETIIFVQNSGKPQEYDLYWSG